MPEYLAPGVFMEEVSYRSKSIEGVGTTTTGFVGPARFGPVAGVPQLLTSLTEFEALYGDGKDVAGNTNYLWHATRAFFDQGGTRLYVSRVAVAAAGGGLTAAAAAKATVGTVNFAARYPGDYGEYLVRIRLVAGDDLVREFTPPGGAAKKRELRGPRQQDVLLVGKATKETLRTVELLGSGDLQVGAGPSAGDTAFALDDVPADTPVRPLMASLDIISDGRSVFSVAGLALKKESSAPSLERFLSPGDDGLAPVTADKTGSDLIAALAYKLTESPAAAADAKAAALAKILAALGADKTGEGVTSEFTLADGADGSLPDEQAYIGEDTDEPTGLVALEHVAEISIVAAPASAHASATDHAAIIQALITHVERMRYRVAVLDGRDNEVETRALRSGIDSTRAAIYYPFVSVADPFGPGTINIPPSGFAAGVYGRNDINRGVWKAPANEVVLGALGFSKSINTARQQVLNPIGINCLRSFENRGHRIWGARTASSDPEWKYLNVRRYFNYLERSIDLSTQWAVFEPNGERLWGNVRRTVSDFLLDEFQRGALLGGKPEEAYFVRCDRSTMTQNDLDNGRLVCLIGVAALKPAEFVIFRIGQWTADKRS